MMRRVFQSLAFLLAFTVAPRAEETLGEFIMHHISNSHEWKITPWGPTLHLPESWEVFGINLAPSLHVFLMFVAAAVLILLFAFGSKRKGLAPVSRLGHALEALVIYVRDEVVAPNLGKEHTPKWLPFFLTIFFFFLTLNLLGLIPGFPATTSNINFTGAMALLVFVLYNAAGMVHNGPVHYFTNLIPKGVPLFVLPIIVPIEIMGLFTKAFALCIRLFANMTAGHILILSLLGIIGVFKSWLVVAPFAGLTLFIYMIEVLVAFLQAYIFTLLAALFVGMAIHQEH
jgi:F-type H+-transporting ATPase subunit a